MDKDLLMDKLFALLRELPELKNLSDIQYDEKHDLVRAQVGTVEKVIPINDKSSIVSEVISWFARG